MAASIAQHVNPSETVSIEKSLWNDWSLQCYMQRHHSISVDKEHLDRKYFITHTRLPKNYRKIVVFEKNEDHKQYILNIRN